MAGPLYLHIITVNESDELDELVVELRKHFVAISSLCGSARYNLLCKCSKN
jgi:hypothetical protein